VGPLLHGHQAGAEAEKHNVASTLGHGPALTSAVGGEPPEIDSGFPGGNIIVDSINADRISLHQDLRDTEATWFIDTFESARWRARRSISNPTWEGAAFSKGLGQTDLANSRDLPQNGRPFIVRV
jgi:hypothetical protein